MQRRRRQSLLAGRAAGLPASSCRLSLAADGTDERALSGDDENGVLRNPLPIKSYSQTYKASLRVSFLNLLISTVQL